MAIPESGAWRAKASSLTLPNHCFNDGVFCDPIARRWFECVNPASNHTLISVARGEGQDIGRAVSSARRAFRGGRWSAKEPGARKEVLLKLAGLVRENNDALALLDTLCMGKLIDVRH